MTVKKFIAHAFAVLFGAMGLACFLWLAGCSGVQTQTQKIETACTGAAAAIKVLAAANAAHKLDASQQAAVSKAIAVVVPVCNPGTPTPPTLDDVKRLAFVQAVDELQARAAGIGH